MFSDKRILSNFQKDKIQNKTARANVKEEFETEQPCPYNSGENYAFSSRTRFSDVTII